MYIITILTADVEQAKRRSKRAELTDTVATSDATMGLGCAKHICIQ